MNQLFDNFKLHPKKSLRGGQRAELIKQIYELYKEDKISRKKENWKRYIKWLKDFKKENNESSQRDFKRGNSFIRCYPIGTFCFLTSHIKTDDLYPMLSTAKDKKNRKENVSGYIAGHFSKIIK